MNENMNMNNRIINLDAATQSALSLSPLMEGRNKVSMEEIMVRFPGGVTLHDFDYVTTVDKKTHEDKTYPVFIIREDDTVCFFGGFVLFKMCRAWVEACGGDVDLARESLKASDIKVKFERGVTSNGNNITKVTRV